MGICQSKKAVREPKKRKDGDPLKPENIKQKKATFTKKENEQDLLKNDGSVPLSYMGDLLNATYKGDVDQVFQLINKYEIQDISQITGFHSAEGITVGSTPENQKTYQSEQVALFNPVVLAVAVKQEPILKAIWENVKQFHKVSCQAKPYTKAKQLEMTFDQTQRLRRDCFCLRLAIRNRDDKIFKFLWNENRLLWNLGHLFVCMQQILTTNWEGGLKLLFASTTTKVLLMSVNQVDDFVEVIEYMKQEFTNLQRINPRMAKKVKEFMFSRPYFIYCIFLEIMPDNSNISNITLYTKSHKDYDNSEGHKKHDDGYDGVSRKPDMKYLQLCLKELLQDDIQFKHKDITKIFSIIDETHSMDAFRDRILGKFEDRDSEIERYLKGLGRVFEKPTSIDSDDHIAILEDLDLFAFSEIKVNEQSTNAVLGALDRGFQKILDYSLRDGFVNLRMALRQTNRYEVKNFIPEIDVMFFDKAFDDKKRFQQMYNILGDQFQLSNFLEIFDLALTHNKPEILVHILQDTKFISLFCSSLEFQKHLFINALAETEELMNNQNQIYKQIEDIMVNNHPYQPYMKDFREGGQGKIYIDKTMKFIERQTIDLDAFQQNQHKGSMIKLQEVKKGDSPVLASSQPPLIPPAIDLNIHAHSEYIPKIALLNNPKRTEEIQDENVISPKEPHFKNNKSVDLLAVPKKGNQKKNGGRSSPRTSSPRFKDHEINRSHTRPNKDNDSDENHSDIKSVSGRALFAAGNNASLPGSQKSKTMHEERKTILSSKNSQTSHGSQAMQEVQSEQSSVDKRMEYSSERVNQKKIDRVQMVAQKHQKQTSDMSKQKSIVVLDQEKKKRLDQSPEYNANFELDLSAESGLVMGDTPSQRIPNIMGGHKNEFKAGTIESLQIQYNPQVARENFEKLPQELLDCITQNNVPKVKFLMSKFQIKNVTSIRNIHSSDSLRAPHLLKMRGNDFDIMSNQSRVSIKEAPDYDTTGWNPVLFAIYYQRTEIAKLLLENYVTNFVMAIRQPPVSEFTEYIISTQGRSGLGGQGGDKLKFQDESFASDARQSDAGSMNQRLFRKQFDMEVGLGNNQLKNHYQSRESEPRNSQGSPYRQSNVRPSTFNNPNQSGTQTPFEGAIGADPNLYCPCEARVECFGLELAIRNKDIQMLMYLWTEHPTMWNEKHFAFVFDKILQEHWDVGIGCVFRSKTAQSIFKALNPEDKDNFLYSKIVDKIIDNDYWERQLMSERSKLPNAQATKITDKQVAMVVEELQYKPYGGYAALKYPSLLAKYGVLEVSLARASYDDIYDYVVARKENLRHLLEFQEQFQKSSSKGKSDEKIIQRLKTIIDKAREIEKEQRRLPNNPKVIVDLIKLGDCGKLKDFFEKQDNFMLLELLNQLQGYEDPDYAQMFKSNVKYQPADETISILLQDNTTFDWNPLIFAIFYQRLDIVQYLCENENVYVRNCLTNPFIIELDEDAEGCDEEQFITEKTEVFALVFCIMLHNKEIFKYLWRRCAYMWNDVHLVVLTYFIFESQWTEGIRILFASANTHQIFNSMNLYEKEKYLKFCDKSILKQNPSAIKDFRYQMAFEPYHVYYLPILATAQELQQWDASNEQTKELFMKNCQLNFDERSFVMLSRINDQYISEFISTAEGKTSSENLRNFARKLKKYRGLN